MQRAAIQPDQETMEVLAVVSPQAFLSKRGMSSISPFFNAVVGTTIPGTVIAGFSSISTVGSRFSGSP